MRTRLLAFATILHALPILNVGTGTAGEHGPVRHFDRAQRFGVGRRIRRKQPVQIEDVGGDRIDVLVTERLWCVLRHGAADIIEQGRGVGPIAADCPDRRLGRQGALTDDQPIADATLTLCAVTSVALLIENFVPVTDAAASRPQLLALTAALNIPPPDLPPCPAPPD